MSDLNAAAPADATTPAPAPATAQADPYAALTAVVGTPAKSLLSSRTVWSIAVSAVATVAQHFGHAISPDDQAGVVTDLLAVVQYAGMAAAVVFRVLAVKPLK